MEQFVISRDGGNYILNDWNNNYMMQENIPINETMHMYSRNQVIDILLNQPNVKITHTSFCSDEYIYGENGKVYDENGYLFEDWISDNDHDGMRIRVGDYWEDGWYLYK